MKEFLATALGMEIMTEEQSYDAMSVLIDGDFNPVQAASLLAAIEMRGIHLQELRGFHRRLSESGITVDLGEDELIDVCGTGGDGKNTFNISTATAFVLAGAGIKVAKHGNSSATSGCGSSDVLAHLGVEFTNDPETLKEDLARAGICYLHAPLFQPGLKAVAPLRREIGFKTFFNILGPLLNPARPAFQFIGVADPGVVRLYRYFLEKRPVQFAIVHSRDGYDEVSLTGTFDVFTSNRSETFFPEDVGFRSISPAAIECTGGIENHAKRFLAILDGYASDEETAVVVANAGFAIKLVKGAVSFEECKNLALESIRSGAAKTAFENLRNRKT